MENTRQPLQHWQKPYPCSLSKKLKENRKVRVWRVSLAIRASSICNNCQQFKMKSGVTFPHYTSIGQKLVLERDGHKSFSSLMQVAIISMVFQQPCMYFAFLHGRKIAGIMPRVPTLLSLTFKNQKRPVKILKNLIFLIIHDTKAALHFSGNPGWQNSTKTRFPEQKMSFSLYWAIPEEAKHPLSTAAEDRLTSLYRSSYIFAEKI